MDLMRIPRIAIVALFMGGCSWASPIVLNFSFETPGLSGVFQYRPAGSNWIWNDSVGIAAAGSAFGVTATPDGSQAAFIQKGSSDISQPLTGLVIGQTYLISFAAAQRPDAPGTTQEDISSGVGYGGGQDFEVLWGATSLGTFLPNSTTFSTYFATPFVATNTSGTLTFHGLDTLGGDRTAFIDAVQVAAPEPQSAATLLTGFGLILLGLRRRRI